MVPHAEDLSRFCSSPGGLSSVTPAASPPESHSPAALTPRLLLRVAPPAAAALAFISTV